MGTDVPAPPKVVRGVRWPLILLAATALGALSSGLAWQFTHWLGRTDIPWQQLALLNYAYWYLWALMTPAIVCLSQCFRFERGRLLRAFAVHLPAVVAACVPAHCGDAGRPVVDRGDGAAGGSRGGRKCSRRRCSISTGK